MVKNQVSEKNIVSEPPTAPESTPTVAKTSKSPMIIMAVVTILSLSLSGYLTYQNNLLKRSIETVQTATTPLPTTNPEIDWKTYSNGEYRLFFDYPPTYSIEENIQPTSNYAQVIINKDLESSFSITAKTDYLPANTTYLLDQSPNGTITIRNHTWNTYYSSTGYGDAGGYSAPYYGVQVEVDSVLYTAIFYNQTSLTEIHEKILSSLQF